MQTYTLTTKEISSIIRDMGLEAVDANSFRYLARKVMKKRKAKQERNAWMEGRIAPALGMKFKSLHVEIDADDDDMSERKTPVGSIWHISAFQHGTDWPYDLSCAETGARIRQDYDELRSRFVYVPEA